LPPTSKPKWPSGKPVIIDEIIRRRIGNGSPPLLQRPNGKARPVYSVDDLTRPKKHPSTLPKYGTLLGHSSTSRYRIHCICFTISE
jgi:hypothetical protein